ARRCEAEPEHVAIDARRVDLEGYVEGAVGALEKPHAAVCIAVAEWHLRCARPSAVVTRAKLGDRAVPDVGDLSPLRRTRTDVGSTGVTGPEQCDEQRKKPSGSVK